MTTFLRLFLLSFWFLTTTAMAAGDTSLSDAVKAGDIAGVRALLDQGADVNAKNEYSDTPLRIVAFYGWKEVAELLIDEGADVDAKDNNGETPLSIAARAGRKKVVELLNRQRR